MIQQTVRQMFLGLPDLENVPRLRNQSSLVGVQLCPPPTRVSVPQGGPGDSPPPRGGCREDGVTQCAVERAVPHRSGMSFSSGPGDTEVAGVVLALKEAIAQWGAVHTCHPSWGCTRRAMMQEEMGNQPSWGRGMGAGF